MGKIAVFIDRDGTINQEMGYVDNFENFHILPMASAAIRKLNDNGLTAILVTNQSGIARGYFPMSFLDELHNKMTEELEKGGSRLDGIYICPHHPDDDCACRKPRPGMLLRAAKEKDIILHKSYVIGDKLIDVRLGQSVGAKGILVRTGYGSEEIKKITNETDIKHREKKVASSPRTPLPWTPLPYPLPQGERARVRGLPDEPHTRPDHIAANLYEAVEWVIEDVKGRTSTLSPPHRGGGTKAGGGEDRILIVKPSSLGDIVHSLPVLWELRRLYPDAVIGWVIKEEWKAMLEGNPLLDDLFVLKKGVGGLLSVSRDIRRMKYNIVLDLQGLFRSGLINILSGAGIRIGFSNARELAHIFYNRKIVVPLQYMHAVDRYLLTIMDSFFRRSDRKYRYSDETNMSLWLTNGHENPSPPWEEGKGEGGLSGEQTVIPHFPLYTDIEDAEWARNFLIENRLYNSRPIIAINPSARWEKKRWPVNSYATLINNLIHELKAGIILLGSREDIPLAAQISSLVPEKFAVAAGKTSLNTLTALLERVNLLVTNDSGPMHIAAAVGKPVVAMFGPTDPRLTGPYGRGHIILRKGMECSPCLRKPCMYDSPLCMETITVGEVMSAVRKILNPE